MIDINKAKVNPSSVFSRPQEVVDNQDLSLADKIAILRQWQYDAIELTRAEEENMAGGEPNLLNRITVALYQLQHKTKH